MKLLRSILSEIIGLFVDDWVFALLLVVWVGLFTVLTPHLTPTIAAAAFFLGIAVLTLLFVARKAAALRTPR